jgi:hypothetical protein
MWEQAKFRCEAVEEEDQQTAKACRGFPIADTDETV